jgi:hypothetical protein
MDNKIDWSLAPKWANKYGLAGRVKYPVWFDNEKYEYLHDGKMYRYSDGCTYSQHEIEMICERPKKWSGPEDGLPPVGTECEYGGNERWFPVTVIAHQSGGFYPEPQAVSQVPENGPLCIGTAKHFRAIRTPEQIANDLRESKIVEFMNTVGVDCRVTATKAVDAGYVREVK